MIKSLFSTSLLLATVVMFSNCSGTVQSNTETDADATEYVLVIHGGAGTISKDRMTPEREAEYKAALEEALQTGYDILKDGGSSLDAVEQTIHVLENFPLFNAGKGAVFTNEGKNELDASIMNGATGEAGAVAGVTTLKNPISAARAVMEKSEHVMMVGKGAEAFAQAQGLETVDPSYFHTEGRWQDLQRALKRDSAAARIASTSVVHPGVEDPFKDEKFGTVGCVALDNNGHLAAGTSTGGMTNKRFGRVGDAPIIGAGTFANEQVAVSCTGWGEFYIRNVVAYDIAALMEYKGAPLAEAAQTALDKVEADGGDGGLIALDKDGRMTMPFNTSGMYRGAITKDGKIEVYIFKD